MVGKSREWFAHPAPDAGQRRGLGPRGRGLFHRLLGSLGGAEVDRRTRREATAIAIASGKGGTGKSFLATSLAVLLHRTGRRVTLVDCDFGLACCHLLLGVTPRASLQQVVLGASAVAEVRIPTPVGPALVPGAAGVRRMANLTDHELQQLGAALGQLAGTEDVLIFDVGAGIAAQTMLTMLCADHVVLVTQPEIAALTDAYAVVKCLAKLRKDVAASIVVNRVPAPGHGRAAFARLAEVARTHAGSEIAFLGEVPDDPLVTQRRLGQQPLVATDPDGATARAVAQVLAALEEHAGPLGAREVEAGRGLEARFREHRLFL